MSTYFKDESDHSGTSRTNGGSLRQINVYYQAICDKLQYYKHERWISVAVLGVFYLFRLFWTRGKNTCHNRLPCIDLLSRNSFTKCFHWLYFAS